MKNFIHDSYKHPIAQADAPHIADGRYDLMNSNGEFILPQVWDKLIKPGESTTMYTYLVLGLGREKSKSSGVYYYTDENEIDIPVLSDGKQLR